MKAQVIQPLTPPARLLWRAPLPRPLDADSKWTPAPWPRITPGSFPPTWKRQVETRRTALVFLCCRRCYPSSSLCTAVFASFPMTATSETQLITHFCPRCVHFGGRGVENENGNIESRVDIFVWLSWLRAIALHQQHFFTSFDLWFA